MATIPEQNERSDYLFWAADPHNHYTPITPVARIANDVRFINNDFHDYILDHLRETYDAPFVPEVYIYCFDIKDIHPNVRPEIKGRAYASDYETHKKIQSFIQRHELQPIKEISLTDAVFAVKKDINWSDIFNKKRSTNDMDGYAEFHVGNNLRMKAYKCESKLKTPYMAVQTQGGTLIFSSNDVGKQGYREYMQYLADNFFNPQVLIGDKVTIYQMEHLSYKLIPEIDRSLEISERGCSTHTFGQEKLIPDINLENADFKHHVSSWHVIDTYPVAPDFLKFIEQTGAKISLLNEDIWKLLDLVHPYHEHKERLKDMKAWPSDTIRNLDINQGFKDTANEIRQKAKTALIEKYDVRGLRSIRNILNDDINELRIGDHTMSRIEKGVLDMNQCLYIPDYDKGSATPGRYLMKSTKENSILVSEKPQRASVSEIRDNSIVSHKPPEIKTPRPKVRKGPHKTTNTPKP